MTDGNLWVTKAKFSAEVNRDSMAGKPGKESVQPIQSHRAIPVFNNYSFSFHQNLTASPCFHSPYCSSLAFSQSFPLDTSHAPSSITSWDALTSASHFLSQISLSDLRDVSTFKLYSYERDGGKGWEVCGVSTQIHSTEFQSVVTRF